MAVLKEREKLEIRSSVASDCAPLFGMIKPLLDSNISLHTMRDPTRGGLAAVLNEISSASGCNVIIEQEKIPVSKAVTAMCSMFGFDPLMLANEGKMVIFCPLAQAGKAVKLLKLSKYGRNASIIGKVTGKSKNPSVSMITTAGGERIIFMPEGEQLPRIC